MNPATEEIIASVPYGNEQDLHVATDAAKAALHNWKNQTPYFRADYLKKTAEIIRKNIQAFAGETIHETGKPRHEAEGEWQATANLFEWYAEEGKRSYGRVIPSSRADKRSQVIYQPIGVVGIITAWNFPAYNPARSAAAALAAGCTVVIKGSEYTPLSSFNLAKAFSLSGIPAGVVNIINGDASAIGTAMLQHPTIKKISFTGSTRVGEFLMNGAAHTHTKLSLELGGNAPVIIDGTVDVEQIAKIAVAAKLRNCGQVCVSPQRFYVHESILDRFLAIAKKAMETIQTGENTGEHLLLGPLINKKQQIRLQNLINQAQKEGANILCGGKGAEKGFFIHPTLIHAEQHMRFIQEEFFGPVMCVIGYETKEEAIQWANETPYGLASYVFTNNLQDAHFYAENLEFGMVGINEWAPHGTELPFVGWKQSGIGHESGAEGLKEYLDLKLISVGGIN
jgi:succinate-semialdehyde dehydrogenase/glutarate-semialdehyde dehydrogenase